MIGNIREALLPYVVEKIKLFKIGYKMVEAMSPETLEKQIRQLEENDRRSTSSAEGAEEESPYGSESRTPSSEDDKVETRKVCNEEIEEVKTGLTLSQAEVEACMKKVTFIVRC